MTGAGSALSLVVLFGAFDDKRFEPDWVAIFMKSSTKKYYTCKVKKNKNLMIEAQYHHMVSKARLVNNS